MVWLAKYSEENESSLTKDRLKNGKKKITYPNLLKDAKFLVSINFEWLYFDDNGNGRFVEQKVNNKLIVPAVSILDVTSNNGFLTFLTKDHILIMDVQK